MKAFLMHRDADFDLEQQLPANAAALTQDLGLDTLLQAMAGGDEFLIDVARHALLSSLTDPDDIVYRQDILRDCMDHPTVVRELYGLAVEAVAGKRKLYYGSFIRTPGSVLSGSVRVLQFLVGILRRLRQIADSHAAGFHSDGFTAFFDMLARDLDDDYFAVVEDHLRQLRFRNGVLISAELGRGCRGTDYVLREQPRTRNWLARLVPAVRPGYRLRIPDRDEAGARALSELSDRGINLVANAVGQSADHIVSFVTMLRRELAFYVGCLNLHDKLTAKGEPMCVPTPIAAGAPALSARGLYDAGLSLRIDGRVVGNNMTADGRPLVMITGANQGGKSTFLRSVGLAQLMMQCGMFVPAEAFRASVAAQVFTHYRREEDRTMQHGKLAEELHRMSGIVDHLRPGCIVLFNESFASTNEREGSQIAHGIVRALLESGVRVVYVTHLYDLAQRIFRQQADDALFLRAERRDDGQRTYRLVPGAPLPTSYGPDLYQRIFGGKRWTATASGTGGARAS